MGQMTVTVLKKKLEQKSKQELIQDISELYKKFPAVKEYYQIQQGDIKLILDKYKDIIKKEFVDGYTKGLPKARLSVARKAVQDFKKMTTNPELLADIMFTFVESISNFNTEFATDDESFYTSPEGMFEKSLELLNKNNLLQAFKERVYRIVDNATEGWGHFDSLQEIYERFYGEFVR
ncbi:conserved hypothetical protein [Gammaproteobacteria bacterium]